VYAAAARHNGHPVNSLADIGLNGNTSGQFRAAFDNSGLRLHDIAYNRGDKIRKRPQAEVTARSRWQRRKTQLDREVRLHLNQYSNDLKTLRGMNDAEPPFADDRSIQSSVHAACRAGVPKRVLFEAWRRLTTSFLLRSFLLLTGGCAAEQAVRRTPDAGRYVLADVVASGPAMFDTARLD
jgi:hypothetical protein